MDKKFYLCLLTFQDPSGLLSNALTAAIASDMIEAVSIASADAVEKLPAGWSIIGGIALFLKPEKL